MVRCSRAVAVAAVACAAAEDAADGAEADAADSGPGCWPAPELHAASDDSSSSAASANWPDILPAKPLEPVLA
jgi:hypothetical protein